MAKCSLCGNRIEVTFLNKIVGTTIKDKKGKKHQVCFECQKKAKNDKSIMISKIK
jgi:hypothetical protein